MSDLSANRGDAGSSGADSPLSRDEQVRAWMDTLVAARQEGASRRRRRGLTDLQGWMRAFLDARSGRGAGAEVEPEPGAAARLQEHEPEPPAQREERAAQREVQNQSARGEDEGERWRER
jgi:hypothetical protein